MPTIAAPEKHRSAWKQLFGQSEKDNFVEGIKNRRLKQDKADPQDYFFDPASSELTAPAAMMTRYLKEGVPDVAKRVQGTQVYKEAMRAMGPRAEAVAELFAERYPRVAAHIMPNVAPTGHFRPGLKGVTHVGRRDLGYPRMTPVTFGQNLGGRELEETMLHEGTHVAQELGLASRGGLAPSYSASTEALKELGQDPNKAYRMNPFEISARTVSDRKMGEQLEPHMAGPRMDKMMEYLRPESEVRRTLEMLRMKRK